MKASYAIALAVLGSLAAILTVQAHAAELQVFSSTALKGVLNALGPQFETSTGDTHAFTLAPSGAVRSKIDQDTAFDGAVVTRLLLKELAASGKVEAGTQAVIARSALGVSVPQGPSNLISTPDALKRALLNAKSIGFNGKGASRAIEAIFCRPYSVSRQQKRSQRVFQAAPSDWRT